MRLREESESGVGQTGRLYQVMRPQTGGQGVEVVVAVRRLYGSLGLLLSRPLW